jgi:hypothetical protein
MRHLLFETVPAASGQRQPFGSYIILFILFFPYSLAAHRGFSSIHPHAD